MYVLMLMHKQFKSLISLNMQQGLISPGLDKRIWYPIGIAKVEF